MNPKFQPDKYRNKYKTESPPRRRRGRDDDRTITDDVQTSKDKDEQPTISFNEGPSSYSTQSYSSKLANKDIKSKNNHRNDLSSDITTLRKAIEKPDPTNPENHSSCKSSNTDLATPRYPSPPQSDRPDTHTGRLTDAETSKTHTQQINGHADAKISLKDATLTNGRTTTRVSFNNLKKNCAVRPVTRVNCLATTMPRRAPPATCHPGDATSPLSTQDICKYMDSIRHSRSTRVRRPANRCTQGPCGPGASASRGERVHSYMQSADFWRRDKGKNSAYTCPPTPNPSSLVRERMRRVCGELKQGGSPCSPRASTACPPPPRRLTDVSVSVCSPDSETPPECPQPSQDRPPSSRHSSCPPSPPPDVPPPSLPPPSRAPSLLCPPSVSTQRVGGSRHSKSRHSSAVSPPCAAAPAMSSKPRHNNPCCCCCRSRRCDRDIDPCCTPCDGGDGGDDGDGLRDVPKCHRRKLAARLRAKSRPSCPRPHRRPRNPCQAFDPCDSCSHPCRNHHNPCDPCDPCNPCDPCTTCSRTCNPCDPSNPCNSCSSQLDNDTQHQCACACCVPSSCCSSFTTLVSRASQTACCPCPQSCQPCTPCPQPCQPCTPCPQPCPSVSLCSSVCSVDQSASCCSACSAPRCLACPRTQPRRHNPCSGAGRSVRPVRSKPRPRPSSLVQGRVARDTARLAASVLVLLLAAYGLAAALQELSQHA